MSAPLLLGALGALTAGAQVRPMTQDTSVTRPGSMPMAHGASSKMSGPHHALAMAYGESLATFARVVNTDVTKSGNVNVELARPATLEMRRSFDQMKVHHTAQMGSSGMAMRMPMTTDSASAMMRTATRDSMARQLPPRGQRTGAGVKPTKSPIRSDSTMRHSMSMPMTTDSSAKAGTTDMAAHMAAIEKHLGMLESEVNAPAPNATQVIEHTAEIMKICAAAMRMPSDGMMGKPRVPGTP